MPQWITGVAALAAGVWLATAQPAPVQSIYDQIDCTHAYSAFVNTMGGVSIASLRKGLASVGVKDNEVIVFSDLMEATSSEIQVVR